MYSMNRERKFEIMAEINQLKESAQRIDIKIEEKCTIIEDVFPKHVIRDAILFCNMFTGREGQLEQLMKTNERMDPCNRMVYDLMKTRDTLKEIMDEIDKLEDSLRNF